MSDTAPPSELAKIQRTLYSAVVDPRGVRRHVRENPATLDLLRDAPPIDRETRLSVYGDAYFLRALEALTHDHPATRRALGEDRFRRLSAEYLASHASTSPSLADFGAGFPAFVAGHPFSRRYGFLADLARLERAADEALLVSRLTPLAPEAFRAVAAESWGAVRLLFDPTVAVLDFAWPVLKLWERREEADGASGRTLRRRGTQTVLLWRDEIWVRAAAIEPTQGGLLRSVMAGEPLGSIFSDDVAVSESDASRWFSSWVSLGLIRGIDDGRRS